MRRRQDHGHPQALVADALLWAGGASSIRRCSRWRASTAAPTARATASPAPSKFDGRILAASKGGDAILAIPTPERGRGLSHGHRSSRCEKITKAYRGVPAVREVDFDLRKGEIHALLGENGAGKSTLTKVMAGVVEATSGRMLYRGKEVQLRLAVRGAARGHRHGVPGDQPGALDDGGAEHLSRRREIPQPPARHLHRRPAIPAVAQLPRRSHRDRRHPGRRQAPDGGDRPRRASQGRGHHLRRADRHADAGGEAPFLRADAAAEGARRVHRLHQPCAGRSAGPCRPHHHPARRRAGGHRRRRQVRPRQGRSAPWSAAPCPTRSIASAAAPHELRKPGAEGAVRPGHLHGQRGAQQLLLDLSRARSPACSA